MYQGFSTGTVKCVCVCVCNTVCVVCVRTRVRAQLLERCARARTHRHAHARIGMHTHVHNYSVWVCVCVCVYERMRSRGHPSEGLHARHLLAGGAIDLPRREGSLDRHDARGRVHRARAALPAERRARLGDVRHLATRTAHPRRAAKHRAAVVAACVCVCVKESQ